jgi:hypothetical protein
MSLGNLSTPRGVVLLGTVILVVAAVPAAAFEILLDIDLDGDPATINEYTEATACVVKVVLAPTEPDEVIGALSFGLGGSCRECEMVHEYGVDFDLGMPDFGPWVEDPDFTSSCTGVLYLGCFAPVSYHVIYYLEPVAGTYTLSAPMFLASFNATVAASPGAPCETPPSNLAAMPAQNTWWNYIQIGGPAVGNEATSWSAMKGLYR